MYKKLSAIIVLLFILPFFAYAGWQESVEGLKATPYYMIPLPPLTREVKQEKTQILGNEFNLTLYTTQSSFDEVTKFYRERLSREGWEEVSNASLPQALIFRKDDELINLQNIPSANARETMYSLGRGNIQSIKSGESQLAEIEFRDLPVYPRAAPIPLGSMRTATKEQIGYTTLDSPERVMQFYREKLPLFGWDIVNEMPLEQYNGTDKLDNCPECQKLPPEALADVKSSSMRIAAFNITKQGKSCHIGAAEIALPGNSGIETIISINCSK